MPIFIHHVCYVQFICYWQLKWENIIWITALAALLPEYQMCFVNKKINPKNIYFIFTHIDFISWDRGGLEMEGEIGRKKQKLNLSIMMNFTIWLQHNQRVEIGWILLIIPSRHYPVASSPYDYISPVTDKNVLSLHKLHKLLENWSVKIVTRVVSLLINEIRGHWSNIGYCSKWWAISNYDLISEQLQFYYHVNSAELW